MLRLRTFGGVSLERDDGVGATLQRRRLGVLIFLAVARDRSVSREKLLAYFWPDADSERARHSLSQLIYGLRRDLNAAAVIENVGEGLRLDREVLWSDVAEFEDAIERRDDERAVALYTGPFLDGWFLTEAPEYERWVDQERARLAEQAKLALRRLADAATASNNHDAALRCWRQLVTMDPLAARPAIGLMNALAATGDRAAALTHARIYETLVREELDATPDPAVLTLAERLRTEPTPTIVRSNEHSRQAPSTPVAPAPPPAPPPEFSLENGGRRKRAASIGGVVLLGILALTWTFSRATAPSRAASLLDRTTSIVDRRSVAVLPFLNISSEPDNEYFSDGMTEELINTLARVDGLRVPARTSAFAFKGKLIGVHEIGEQLRVATVLEGSVRRTGKRLRVTAQLIDVASGYELWSDVYDRELTDIFQVQEEIARAIAARLKGDLLRDSRTRATTNADAYDLYLRGRYFWNERTYASLLKSIEYYQRALALDSNYALAYAGLADSYAILGSNGFRPLAEVLPKAEAAGTRALTLDSTLSSVHATRALMRWLSWQWSDAEAEFRRSIALDSVYPPARLWYALYLSGMRRPDEAIRQITRARELDPLSLVVNAELGHVLELARRDSEAELAYRRTVEIDSTYWLANYLLTLLHFRRGQFSLARSDLARMGQGHELDLAELQAYGHARSGDTAAARRTLAKLQRLGRQRYVSPYAISYIYAALGEQSTAIQWLETAYAQHTSEMSLFMADPMLDPVRQQPGYAQLVRRMHLE